MTISKQEFARRRKKLMALMEPDSIAVVPSAKMVTRNRDSEYAFRQDSDFYYLTGFDEPDAVLVLLPGRATGECVLFCQDRDPAMELWTGYRAGPEGPVLSTAPMMHSLLRILTTFFPACWRDASACTTPWAGTLSLINR